MLYLQKFWSDRKRGAAGDARGRLLPTVAGDARGKLLVLFPGRARLCFPSPHPGPCAGAHSPGAAQSSGRRRKRRAAPGRAPRGHGAGMAAGGGGRRGDPPGREETERMSTQTEPERREGARTPAPRRAPARPHAAPPPGPPGEGAGAAVARCGSANHRRGRWDSAPGPHPVPPWPRHPWASVGSCPLLPTTERDAFRQEKATLRAELWFCGYTSSSATGKEFSANHAGFSYGEM